MKLPRLVALDLDDTLLSDNLEISDFTVAVIDFLAEVKGVHFALSSGRSYESLKPYIERLGFQKRSFFCICENGTKIIKTDTAALVEEYGLEFSVALEAYKTGLENGFTCQVYRDDYIIASAENPYSSDDRKLSGLKLKIENNFEELLKQNFLKLVFPGTPERISALEKIMGERIGDRATVFISKPFYLEVLPKDVDKGFALSRVAGFLNIPEEYVMAFGDAMNDLAMLRWAGQGVAMKNGVPEIIKISKFSTDYTNNEDGVARYLKKIFNI